YRQLARRQMAKLHNGVQEIPFSRSQSIGARAISMHDDPTPASRVCTVAVHIMGWRQPDGIGTSTDSTYRSWLPEGKRHPAVAVIARGERPQMHELPGLSGPESAPSRKR